MKTQGFHFPQVKYTAKIDNLVVYISSLCQTGEKELWQATHSSFSLLTSGMDRQNTVPFFLRITTVTQLNLPF